MTYREILSIAVVMLGISGWLGAQENTPLKLDLKESLQVAQQNNLEIVRLQKQLAVAQADVQTEGERANPDLLFERTRSTPNYFVGAGYTFDLSGKRGNKVEIAKQEVTLAEMDLQNGVLEVRRKVRTAFYKVVQSRERLEELSQARDLAKRLVDISQGRYELGEVARFEVLQAQLELKKAENDMKQQESEGKAALIELNSLLNRDVNSPIEVQGALEDVPGEITLDAIVQQAMLRNTDLLKAQQEEKAEQARLNLAKAERIPDLSVEAGAEIHDPEFQYGFRGALTMELPLLNTHQGEIKHSQATLEALKAEQEATRQKIRADIAEAFARYQAALYRVENYKKDILPEITEIEELSEESYHEGKTGILSVIDAQRNMRETRLEYLDALMDFQTAVADLESSAGVDLP